MNLATLGAVAVAGLGGGHAIPSSHARSGDAVATVTGSEAVLADGRIRQAWSLQPRGQVTVNQVRDQATGRAWARAGTPDFSLLLNSVPTTSTSGWRLIDATAQPIPYDRARPHAGHGVEIVFRYGLALRRGRLDLDRTWRLFSGAGVEEVSERIVNRTPLVLRVGKYSLAQLTATKPATATVLAFHGGSDWRQDFRSTTTEPGAFDDEGEVARFDNGSGSGWFLVGQRRGGAMSRVGQDSGGRTWVGVDNARDAFDWGPIMSSPPNYNRQENPAYPAPVRQRTLAPLGTLDLGEAYLGVYHGGVGQAAATFVQDFAGHVMPAGRQTVDLNTFHPWSHGSGLSDANLRPQAQLFKQLGGEVFMLDDQWQGSSAGDWQWDPSRFPLDSGGVPQFVDHLHSLGVKLGLWMSPAEFNPGAAVYKDHPRWACTPVGHATAQIPDDSGLGVWDMTNKRLQRHLTDVISRLITQDGVREFKFDYVAWVDCPPHDYVDYEDAYVHWVKLQERLHPRVTFQLDETNDQRLWAFRSAALGPSWFDNGHLQGTSYPTRLLHDVWSAAPWVPPSSLAFGLYDGDLVDPYSVDYLMPMALLSHVTFWSDLTKLTDAQLAETAWWLAWYKAHRRDLSDVVYEDTATDPVDGKSWAAFQPWEGDHGYLFAFRQDGSAATQTVPFQGVRPGVRYRLTDVRTGRPLGTVTGARLERGLALTLDQPYSAIVLSVRPA
ncbi:MAG: alpha-galactosidase [Solirubrobacteraceae bacterium]